MRNEALEPRPFTIPPILMQCLAGANMTADELQHAAIIFINFIGVVFCPDGSRMRENEGKMLLRL